MLYITGDTHGEHARMRELAAHLREGDTLLITGDFGYVYRNDAHERLFLREMEELPFTICFCDGNHENFPALASYPEERFCGGRIHRIGRNIIHLCRGQIFTLEDKRIFTMGGAYSVDRYMLREGISFWREELPSGEEYREAAANLAAADFKVDYILTHTAPSRVIGWLGYRPDAHGRELEGFLDWVMAETDYRGWYFGHWHEDRVLDECHRALWYDLVAV